MEDIHFSDGPMVAWDQSGKERVQWIADTTRENIRMIPRNYSFSFHIISSPNLPYLP